MSASKVTLYRGFPFSGRYTWSPFVTKLEFRLRANDLPYNVEAGSTRNAPRGKIPYSSIAQPEAPMHQLSDSTLIIQDLVQNGELADLNKGLSPRNRALDIALRALLEDKLYFYNSFEKWQQNFYIMRSAIFASMSYPSQLLFGYLARRTNYATLWGQGTARFSAVEIADFRQDIWEHVNELLSASNKGKQEGPFWILGGDEPTEADASLFGFVAGTLVCDAAPDSQKVIRAYPNIVEYARRIHDRYFPDYEVWD